MEIGCGGGADLDFFSRQAGIKSINAIDLGSNVSILAKKYQNREDITVKEGNALSLGYQDKTFDTVYSFGVFHHTSDPIECLKEAYRVLRQDGKLFLYLYSAHEDNLFKRVGVGIESLIMVIFSKMSYGLQNILCYLLSPICWLFFSLPSIFLKAIGLNALAHKLPFSFGTHPLSLINDLKDRLMAPVNHRFTKKKMEEILRSNKFNSFKVVKKSSGLYIFAEKF